MAAWDLLPLLALVLNNNAAKMQLYSFKTHPPPTSGCIVPVSILGNIGTQSSRANPSGKYKDSERSNSLMRLTAFFRDCRKRTQFLQFHCHLVMPGVGLMIQKV